MIIGQSTDYVFHVLTTPLALLFCLCFPPFVLKIKSHTRGEAYGTHYELTIVLLVRDKSKHKWPLILKDLTGK